VATLSLYYFFYKAFVRSLMEYGAFLYDNAPESTLLLLERIQNHAIRLALGATKTTPILSLQSESKIPPLSFRRTKVAQQHTLRAVYISDITTLNKFHTVYNS